MVKRCSVRVRWSCPLEHITQTRSGGREVMMCHFVISEKWAVELGQELLHLGFQSGVVGGGRSRGRGRVEEGVRGGRLLGLLPYSCRQA